MEAVRLRCKLNNINIKVVITDKTSAIRLAHKIENFINILHEKGLIELHTEPRDTSVDYTDDNSPYNEDGGKQKWN